MKLYNIIECLPSTLSNQFDFTVAYDEETYTVFDTSFFISEIHQHFSDRMVKLADTDPVTNFKALFDIWAASREDNYARRMYALAIEYNPLENYDRMEEQSATNDLEHGETVTRTHADTETESYTNFHDKNTKSGSVTTTSGIYGVNSSTAVNSDTSTDTFNNVEDDHTKTGSVSDAHTGTITDAHTGTDSTESGYELHAHGNIGSTTSAQMLAEDLGFLSKDIALIALCDFIDRYTNFVEGVYL